MSPAEWWDLQVVDPQSHGLLAGSSFQGRGFLHSSADPQEAGAACTAFHRAGVLWPQALFSDAECLLREFKRLLRLVASFVQTREPSCCY
ncbi:MAG TPA: hypothetical protein VF844_00095 [Ktedonobacteraceae bacterium]